MASKTIKVQMVQCRCERCGHQWKSHEKPLRCAKCKTPYWDIKPSEAKAAD